MLTLSATLSALRANPTDDSKGHKITCFVMLPSACFKSQTLRVVSGVWWHVIGDAWWWPGRGDLKASTLAGPCSRLVRGPWMMIPTRCSVWKALGAQRSGTGKLLQSIQSNAKFYVPSLVFEAQVTLQTILSIVWSHQPLASSCKTWNCLDTKVRPPQTLSTSSSWLSSSAFCYKYIPPRTLLTQVWHFCLPWIKKNRSTQVFVR